MAPHQRTLTVLFLAVTMTSGLLVGPADASKGQLSIRDAHDAAVAKVGPTSSCAGAARCR